MITPRLFWFFPTRQPNFGLKVWTTVKRQFQLPGVMNSNLRCSQGSRNSAFHFTQPQRALPCDRDCVTCDSCAGSNKVQEVGAVGLLGVLLPKNSFKCELVAVHHRTTQQPLSAAPRRMSALQALPHKWTASRSSASIQLSLSVRMSSSIPASLNSDSPRFRSWPITETASLSPLLSSMGMRIPPSHIDGTSPGAGASYSSFYGIWLVLSP